MRARINAVYRRPYPKDFYEHFRNDLGLTEDYKKIMDSLRKHSAGSEFHYQNTFLPATRFEADLKQLTDMHLTELIRLAIIGFQTENTQKINE